MIDDSLVVGVLRLLDRAEQCCGNCQQANHDDAGNDKLTFCTHPAGFYRAKLMQRSARCESWVASS